MVKSDFPYFYAILPSEGGKSFEWCGGTFAPGCDYLSSGDLKAELRKPGYKFCAHILAPCLNLFQQFTDAGDLKETTQNGLYWATVWTNRNTGKSVYGFSDAPLMRAQVAHRMIETGYMGMEYGFNFSKFTSIPGMKWYDSLMLLSTPDNGSVWAVTSDGTSHGDYENGASTTLFATESDARDFVRAELADQIVNGFFTGESPTKEEIEREVAAHCTWFGEHEAQFRNGDAIADYKIEKMSLPRKAQKGE